jgi:hypothetical protein
VITPPTGIGPGRPLRVHVLGSSCAVLVEPEHGPRDGGTYGEQLVVLLASRDIPAIVTHAGTWFGRISDALPHYERDVRDHFADVLVINFGMAECQSDLLPTPVARHLTTWRRSSGRLAGAYRSRLVPVVWRQLRSYQRWAAAHDGASTYRLRPRRFVADMTRTIDLVRKDCAPLVLLLDIDPPGERIEHWMPGTAERARRYNALLDGIADKYDEAVRLVPAGRHLNDPASQLPDGLHRSVAGHRMTAVLLADEIASWLGR